VALLEVGLFARDALAGGDGRVCAVFRRSLYLAFPGGRYACIGERSLGRGPLNALVSDWQPFASLAPGDRFGISPQGAKLWQPARPGRSVTGPQLADRVRELAGKAAARAASDGLGRAIARCDTPLLRSARPAMTALDRWLAATRPAPVPRQTAALIGLGPGLTPSGDDYLTGMLVALRSLGRTALAVALWRWLAPRLPGGTSEISRAHLVAAAQGEAHEALHACLGELLGARAPQWERRLAQLARVGHCSGWDALAGTLAVARAEF
jgi:hypothetical protein